MEDITFNFCSKIITLPQTGSTCWFNTLLMAIIYSQNSRKLIMKLSKTWNTDIEIYKILKEILYKKYLNENGYIIEYTYFLTITPEYILNNLNKYNEKKFFKLELFNNGYYSYAYIRKLYKLLGASLIMFDLYDNILTYSKFNKFTNYKDKDGTLLFNFKNFTIDKIKENINPDIIIINDLLKNDLMTTDYSDKIVKDTELVSFNDTIIYNSSIYILDSIILNSWNGLMINNNLIGHSIAGLTCKNKRFIYNGLPRIKLDKALTGIDKPISIPCQLMEYEWNAKRNSGEFCINSKKCIKEDISEDKIEDVYKKKLCYNFGEPERILIYIKKLSGESNISIDHNISSIGGENKTIINPLTDKVIKLENFNKKFINRFNNYKNNFF